MLTFRVLLEEEGEVVVVVVVTDVLGVKVWGIRGMFGLVVGVFSNASQ